MNNINVKLPISINDVREAKFILKNNSRISPLVKSFYLSGKSGGEVYLKLENMQLTGSFKFRGAFNKISHLSKEEKSKGVIACSAGNHAQGVALSCHLQGIRSKIVMPVDAPKAKISATEGYGAEVVLFGDSFDEAKAKCLEIQKETGETFIAPYDDPYVMAGQGTIGLEILDEIWDVDTVIVPVGGGGLISGMAVALKAFNPLINIIGVQAERVHGMAASFKEGKITSHKEGSTLADGCAVQTPGVLTFEIVNELVTDMILVSEDEIELAMKDLIQRTKSVVEGGGALATAAILSGKVDKYVRNKKVVAVISGGNVDLSRISDIMGHFLTANELIN
ncbi:bifunctional threonine ammonia-lyase/L-serine ammonia-lyase TdcB [Marinilactibacillus psychrotolerans]|uniref:L-threonine dehydratase catabolic TdcB n=1 Tax=Marinilactibacillus psychrotolerans TaxID=191770 RepID=A0A5R9C2N9_9LACT|nr:bifunctional threonine ammonia-lyase/L-serine ammonia-lyase TdcB [Marinilactibacillus psychrotolerans]MDN6318036.1 bifunctional threonine ammonia-lyase/L-serine ammonia-lyase TdcB [Lactococcus lactis]TLQ07005.1 bifunctional threonine ammonia-lyase/L-serine ammonia-lyase TdcB [Marinilactibacillus psychrotolerans]